MGTERLDWLQRRHRGGPCGQNHVRERNQFRHVFAQPVGIAQSPSILDTEVSAVGPASFLQALDEGVAAGLPFRISCRQIAHQHADAPHPLALLRACRQRPCNCRHAEQRDELAPPHSITSSARASTAVGTSMRNDFAVLRLTTMLNFVGKMTGSSPGFSPFTIRPT